jgi:hypothetical protein
MRSTTDPISCVGRTALHRFGLRAHLGGVGVGTGDAREDLLEQLDDGRGVRVERHGAESTVLSQHASGEQ